MATKLQAPPSAEIEGAHLQVSKILHRANSGFTVTSDSHTLACILILNKVILFPGTFLVPGPQRCVPDEA